MAQADVPAPSGSIAVPISAPVSGSIPGQVAIVTDATTGRGRAIAASLAAHGVHLCLVAPGGPDLRGLADDLADRHGIPVFPAAVDLADHEAVDRLVAHVEQRLGGVEIVVCTSVADESGGPVWTLDPVVLWPAAVRALAGSLLLTRALAGQMVQRRHGHVVAVTSPGTVGRAVSGVAAELAAQVDGTGVVVVEVLAGAADDESVAAVVTDAVLGRHDDSHGGVVTVGS
jgi:NAD(P)-dependent dehydrogenase (short-subunit alcohol dehydrogenase family)